MAKGESLAWAGLEVEYAGGLMDHPDRQGDEMDVDTKMEWLILWARCNISHTTPLLPPPLLPPMSSRILSRWVEPVEALRRWGLYLRQAPSRALRTE